MRSLLIGLLLQIVIVPFENAFALPEIPLSGKCTELLTAPKTENRDREIAITVLRDKLKKETQLEEEPRAYEWTHPKLMKGTAGESYQIKFEKSFRLTGLSPALARLITSPWGAVYQGERVGRTPPGSPLYEKPIMEIHAVDTEEMTVYHETGYGAIEGMLRQRNPGSLVTGTMAADRLRLSNASEEPTFFTNMDPLLTRVGLDNVRVIFEIKTRPAKKMFLLVLNQPASELEKNAVMEILSGDPLFWSTYQEKHRNGSVYDFDLFQNATVGLLREKYGIPVDFMVFTHDMMLSLGRGQEPRGYSWVNFYNRALLEAAHVNVFWNNYSRLEYDFVNKKITRTYFPLSNDLYQLLVKYPLLEQEYGSWGLIEGPDTIAKKFNLSDFRPFYRDFDEPFKEYITSGNGLAVIRSALEQSPDMNASDIKKLFIGLGVEFAAKLPNYAKWPRNP